MSFAASAFAETSFAHDSFSFNVGPIYPFNSDTLTFSMDINTICDFLLIINSMQTHDLNINKTIESKVIR